MSGRLGRLLARPLEERERGRVFAAVAVGLLLAAAVLTFITPPREMQPAPTPTPTASVPAPAAMTTPSTPADVPAVILHAGRRFLSDYLSFLYGHTRGQAFHAASASLAHRLASRPPRVSPAMRRRRPRVAALSGHRLASRSRWVLTATIADGGVRYPIELVIATRPRGGAMVVRIGEL
jgi:hypothetical protein